MNILIDGQTLESPEINRGIGIYFKNVLNNMVKQSYEHRWYITVSNVEFLMVLDPWVVTRLIPVVNDIFIPGSDFERTTKFTKQIKKIIEEMNIELLWIPNPLMVNVLFPNEYFSCKVFMTVYDLIPHIMPVKEWSNNIKQEYNRRLDYLSHNDINLICISEATKNDVIKIIGNTNTYITFLAADSKLFYKKRMRVSYNEKPYIIFTGGFDYRKNIYGAIEAFKRATVLYSGTVMDKVSMYIVCKCSEDDKAKFNARVKDLHLEGRIKLTGFVSDKELSELYGNSDVFFFPSLYEGFGLPILEAMLSGAFILSADNSSLPEVCDEYAILCNAKDTEDMAEKLYLAFQRVEKETLEEKQKRQEYALNFSWEKTATKTLECFRGSVEYEIIRKKEKLAIVTPWPNQKTGIANYIYKLVPYLSKIYDIDIFVDNKKKNDYLNNEYGGLYDIEELKTLHNNYKEIIYEMGNNSDFHKKIYEYSLRFKGIAEIHDYILHPFFYHAYYLKNKSSEYREALEYGYGKKGLQHYNNVKKGIESPDEIEFPMSHTLCNSSKAVIFHNHWSKDQINSDHAFVIPHACFDKEIFTEDIKKSLSDNLSKKIAKKENELIIGCFGFVNANKRPEKIIDAILSLINKDYKIKLVFFGKSNDELYRKIESIKMKDNIFITGYLEKGEYELGIEMCDIVVNLRYPSMGESSGTLCEAFKYGKPVLVSDINQYKEFPDEVCWKVDVGDFEVHLLETMLEYLINNTDVRHALGENAMAYANSVLNPENIVRQYYEIISKISGGS